MLSKNFRPKKSLGQNFLTDKNIQNKIMAAADFSRQDAVLEIGPGKGELTRLLATRVKRLYAVEIDPALYERLRGEFAGSDNIEIINRDILRLDLDKLIRPHAKIKAIGNIPYYLSTPIIEYLLDRRSRIETVFLTVQKEFGRRLAALPGSPDYGALSCFVQYYCRPEILFEIGRNSFRPAPKVDSCFLRLAVREKPAVAVRDEKRFFGLVRAAFAQRRKTLRNSLKDAVVKEQLEIFFTSRRIPPNTRPEDLGLDDFACLANS